MKTLHRIFIVVSEDNSDLIVHASEQLGKVLEAVSAKLGRPMRYAFVMRKDKRVEYDTSKIKSVNDTCAIIMDLVASGNEQSLEHLMSEVRGFYQDAIDFVNGKSPEGSK